MILYNKQMSLREKLDQLLKRIGVYHLVPTGKDEALHTWVCQLLGVESICSVPLATLQSTNSGLHYLASLEDQSALYDICRDYKKSLHMNKQ